MPATTAHCLNDYLTGELRVGEADVHGPLAVFPLFGPTPELEYVAFAQGTAAGVVVKELEDGARVNDLLVINPTDTPVLLFEGEEVLGAQQNRTFDTSVLVPARGQLQVPVSCVEAGRWDRRRAGDHFAPAPQAAYPALRRMKNEAARAQAEMGQEARAEQGAVWSEVAAKSARMGAVSATGAMHDVFEDRRDRLAAFLDAIPLHDGQAGAIAAIGGRMTVLDHVSRPEVFAALHQPLLQGYALDALEVRGEFAASHGDATGFASAIQHAELSERDGIGLGRDARFARPGVGGAALIAGNELIQVSAFADDPDAQHGPAANAGRIRRPSRRGR